MKSILGQTQDFTTQSDEEILARSVAQPSAFETIVNRYNEAFLRKTRSLIGNRPEVDDIVQETFTKIYFNAPRFAPQEGARFSSWAYKILINTTFSYYRKFKKSESRVANLEMEILETFPDLSKSDIEHRELSDDVISVLTRLPKNLSRVLSLQFLKGLSQAEIAEAEGISVNAVKTRVHRAKAEFKKEATLLYDN
jgi:RNA polymerase sigma-70 factor (ECF subfamily)